MKTNHVHLSCGAALRRWLVTLPLVVLSLSANANFIARTTHGNFEIVRVGKTTELRPPQTVMGNGNAIASTGTVTQGMGATAGGPTAASGVNLGGTATVPVNGSNVPVAVKTNVGSEVLIPAALGALGCVSGGVVGAAVCAGAAVAAPLALNWLANAGGRINPANKQLEVADPANPAPDPSDGYKWQLTGGPAQTIYSSPGAACFAYLSHIRQVTPEWGPYTLTDCTPGVAYGVAVTGENNPNTDKRFRQAVYRTTQSNGCPVGYYVTQTGQCVSDGSGGWLPKSMDDIAPYMKKVPVDPGIVKQLTDAGQELGNPPLQVTGPSTVPGPSSTTINITSPTTTTTTVTNTTNNYNYNGNKVTNTGQTQTTTTTTTTKNPDGSTTTSTPTTSTTTTTTGEPAKPEEQLVQCDKYPNSLGCAEMDVPSGDIPKDSKNITFSEQTVLAGGSCPPDRQIGQDYTFSYASTCSTITSYVRPLVLMIAGWMAIVIIFSIGKTDT